MEKPDLVRRIDELKDALEEIEAEAIKLRSRHGTWDYSRKLADRIVQLSRNARKKKGD